MRLQIMIEEAVTYIKKNIDSLTYYYENGEDPRNWLKLKIGKNPFVEVDAIEFEDFNLFINPDKPSGDDITNCKILYTNLMQLNDSFASDERLWAGLSHTLFYDYMQKRWPGKTDAKSIINHYFFTSVPRSYMVNTLAKLWWLGRMTYIEEDEDHFKILDFMAHDINGYAFTLYGSNWSNNKKTRNAFFEALFAYENETNNRVGRELFNEAVQHMNAFCGIYLADSLSDSFIIENIKKYLVVRDNELKKEAEENKANNVRLSGVNKFDNIIKALNSLGGVGTFKEIYDEYLRIQGRDAGKEVAQYLKDNMLSNCIDDDKRYNGKPIFYVIKEDGIDKFKISNEYLTNNNSEKRNQFIEKQIAALSDDEKNLFNILTSIKKDTFSINDIYAYETQFASLHPDIENIREYMFQNINRIRFKGLIELVDKNTFKKSYKKRNV